MTTDHGGERTGEQAGALASARGSAGRPGGAAAVAPGADVLALQVLRGDESVLAVPSGVVQAVLGPSPATRRFVGRLSGTSGARAHSDETVLVAGGPVRMASRAASSAAGIALVTDGRAISWSQSIGDNVLLGSERGAGLVGSLARLLGRRTDPAGVGSSESERVSRALGIVGLDRDPTAGVAELTSVERRLLELARAVAAEAAVIVVDDTGAALQAGGERRWWEAIVAVADAPRPTGPAPAVLLVTGTVTGLSTVATRATVLAGSATAPPTHTLEPVSAADEGSLLQSLADAFGAPDVPGALGDVPDVERPVAPVPDDSRADSASVPRFEVERWSASHPADTAQLVVDGLGFSCAPGEIVGLFGPPDAGAGEVLLSIFGRSYGTRVSGVVRVDGEIVDVSTTDAARSAGVLYTTEHPIRFDLSFLGGLPSSVSPESLTRLVSTGVADPRREYRATTVPSGIVAAIPGAHRGPSADQFTDSLQLLVDSEARVVLLAEPFGSTNDAGAARRRALIRSLAAGGRAVVISSEDPAALAAVCDRVIGVRGGRAAGETSAGSRSGSGRITTRAVLGTLGGLA